MNHPRRLSFGLVLLGLNLAGCTGLGTQVGPTGPLGTSGDLISNNSGSIISNNSGSLTGVFRAPSDLVSNNTGSYRIGALTELPVGGATVTAYDLAGERVTGAETKTAVDGRFTLAIPKNRPVVVRATIVNAGKSYVFQTLGVTDGGATGSANLSAGTTLAAESLLRMAAEKGMDVGALVTSKLDALSSVLGDAVAPNRINVFSEGQAALLDFTNSLMANDSDMGFLASALNGYTGLAYFDGALHLADNTRGMLLRQTSSGAFTSWLGGLSGTFADGPLSAARFASVYGMVQAADRTIYFVDAGNQRIRKVSPAGVVSTLAGGLVGFSDGTGTAAQFLYPTSLALSGNALFVTDTFNNLIRRIDLASGAVTTVAGSLSATNQDDGPGTSVRLSIPRAIVADNTGTLYFLDSSNSTLRRLASNGNGTYQVETIAGSFYNPTPWAIVNGPGATARFFLPMAMAYHAGALYIADTMNHAVRKVDLTQPDYPVSTVAGGGPNYPGKQDGTLTTARFRGPDSIAVAADGTIYVGDGGNLSLRKISGTSVTTLGVTVSAE